MQDTTNQTHSGPDGASPAALREKIISAIRTVFDPEIEVNIYELGLIYRVDVDGAGRVEVDMTLTSPNCPAAQELPAEVQDKVRAVPGVKELAFELLWEPPWGMERMSEEAKLELGLM